MRVGIGMALLSGSRYNSARNHQSLMNKRYLLLASFLAAVLTTALHAADPAADGRRVLAADYSKNRVALFDSTGKILWQRKTAGLHDLSLLPSGNVLMGDGWTKVIEVQPGLDGKEENV